METTISLECSRKSANGSQVVTPILWELHWLLICFQAQFKVQVVTFKTL